MATILIGTCPTCKKQIRIVHLPGATGPHVLCRWCREHVVLDIPASVPEHGTHEIEVAARKDGEDAPA